MEKGTETKPVVEGAGDESAGSLGILNGGDGTAAGDSAKAAGNGSENDANEGAGQNQLETAVAAAVASALPAVAKEIETALGSRFDAVADRRVNAILKEVRQGQNPSGKGGSAGDESGGGEVKTVVEASYDVQGARQVYREFVTDKLEFVNPTERDLGLTMAEGLIRSRFVDGETDIDNIGRLVAEAVATQISELRDGYEKQIVGVLRKAGRIVETPGQPAPTPGTKGAGSGSGGPVDPFKHGAAQADRLFPGRNKTEAGVAS